MTKPENKFFFLEVFFKSKITILDEFSKMIDIKVEKSFDYEELTKTSVKDNLFEIPPLFNMIQGESGTNWREMYQVFNMGHRMEIYVDNKYADEIISISKSFNVDAKIIGKVEECDAKKWRTVMETNLDGVFYLSQALTAQLKKTKGSIVNIASISGLRGSLS